LKFIVKAYTIDSEIDQPVTLWLELEHKARPKDAAEARYFFERLAGLLHGSEVEIMNSESEVGK
jgi:hypothetical protein